jgi:hypothetical protein
MLPRRHLRTIRSPSGGKLAKEYVACVKGVALNVVSVPPMFCLAVRIKLRLQRSLVLLTLRSMTGALRLERDTGTLGTSGLNRRLSARPFALADPPETPNS